MVNPAAGMPSGCVACRGKPILSDHAKYAPSASSRWLRCPGSVRICEQLPQSSGSDASAEGTRLHDLAAKCLLSGADSDIPAVQTYLDEVRRHSGTLHVETRVHVAPDCWGSIDAGVVGEHETVVIDLKTGKSPVSPVSNSQLMLYALGADAAAPRDYYQLCIVQPNGSSGFPVKMWPIARPELLAFREKVLRAIDRAESPRAPIIPGKHCYWCTAKHGCSEYMLMRGRE